MNIAIVGLADSTHDKAPWGEKDWEIWGLPWDAYFHQCDLGFEMHDRRLWENPPPGGHGGPDYLERLKDSHCPIYMQQAQPDIPMSATYPLKGATALVGPLNPYGRKMDYYESSPAYQIALATLRDAEKIGIWGCELRLKDGHDHGRPNIEYLLGFAAGRGIEVTVARPSGIFLHTPINKYGSQKLTYPTRYGWLN